MTTDKERIEKAVEKVINEACPACMGHGAILTGKLGSFASLPCRKCKGTGKRQTKGVM